MRQGVEALNLLEIFYEDEWSLEVTSIARTAPLQCSVHFSSGIAEPTLMLEIVLGRYGAVSAERSEEGVCGVLGVSSPDQEEDPWLHLKAVQCALDLLDAIQEMQLPGGGTLPARIGLHSGAAADGLVGCANTLQYRLAGPALSVAKALAKAAPWDGILASMCVMPGQLELGHLWQRAQPLRVSRDGTLDTYLLPVQAAPAYAEHPSAPQSKTRGPNDWTVCKRPCASAAWRVHDGGTALHGGLPPGYQSWTLSVRATAASFASRDGPGAPAAGAAAGPKPPSPTPAPSGSMPAPDDMSGPRSSHVPTATAAAAAGSSRPKSQRAAEATAAFRLLQDSCGGSEQGSHHVTSSDEECASSADGLEALEHSQGSSDGSVHSCWQPEFAGHIQSALTAAEAPMGLAAFPTPRPRRWVSVAPSAWENPVSDATRGLQSLPILNDSLLLGIPEPTPSSRSNAPRPLRRLAPLHLSAPASLADRSELSAPTSAAQAASRLAPLQPAGRTAMAARPSGARPSLPGSTSVPGQLAARVEMAAHPVSVQLRRPMSTAAPEKPAGRLKAAARASADPPVAAPTAQGSSSNGVQLLTEGESAASCWRGVLAAAAARFGARQEKLVCLDLPDGTSVLQDAKLEFKDLTLEKRFRAMWARQKRGHDCAVLLFFFAMFLLREMPLMLSLGATRLPSPGGLAAACFMLAVLALMHFNQEFYERRRSAFSTLTRFIRTCAVSWHHFHALSMGTAVAGSSCQPGLPFFSILAKNALPWAAMSMCEGNLLSAHLLGDALALTAAAVQAPCLCSEMCTVLGRSGCAICVVLQAFGALLLPTAMMYML
ncbi:g10736 [Coccomyxa elongata]